MVKADFYTDPDLLQWPRAKRDLYRSLWALAEDSYCIEDSPFGWKVAAWPSPLDTDMTVEAFAQWRDELIAEGKLLPYDANGKRYLFLPDMAKHENPRNPQSPNLPLPTFIEWSQNEKDARKGSYIIDMGAVQVLYNAATTLPVLPCPVLPCPDPSSKDKTMSFIGIPETLLGYWVNKNHGKEPTPAQAQSLRVLCKKYPHQIVGGAIGQAVLQGERADNFALITTICKADSGGAK
jgi:hypothetical protein